VTTETVEPVHTFDQSSPVLAYWLTRCEGFEVTAGRRTGVVEQVALDRLDERADHLVVKFPGLRRVIVPSEAVRAVVPAEELLVLQPPEEPEPRLAPAAQRAKSDGARAVRASARASAGAAVVAGRATSRGATAAWREAGRASHQAGDGARRFGVWARPRAERAGRTLRAAAIAFAIAVATAVAAVWHWLRTEVPPAARAVARRTSDAAADLRTRIAAARQRPSELEPEEREQRRKRRAF
jgi:hypothetical protein